MNRMMLVLKRSPDQESALQDLLTQQQINSSANFRKWLTPDMFGQQFGPADADIQAVTSWLTSFGFQSIKVSKGRNIIEFSGTAAQVETALHTSIHKYFVNGENHWANTSDPQIPAALAPVISGIVSLHDFHPKPAIVKSDRKLTASVTPGPRPQINLMNSSGQVIHALVPADFNTIYNIANTMTGSGVTIGIIANANINVQDVADFRNFVGLSAKNPTIILNGPDPGDIPGSAGEGEAVLDATWSGAVAPAATVDLVVSEDTNASSGADLSELYIIDNNLADVMTESFSACESQFVPNLTGPFGAASFYSGLAEQAAAQGITDVVASGDGGPDSCDDPSTLPSPPTQASVNLLASTPFTVAVGGTEFHDCDPLPPLAECADNSGTYWLSMDGTNHGSAKSYIPEKVWNESCTVAQQVGPPPGCPASGLWSSGGGPSIVFGASSDFPTAPPWQAGVSGLPTGNHPRLVPDVAMTAADHDGYVLCIDGSCQGIGCPPPASACYGIASGTSASAQVFGGVMALVVQKVGARVGIANYALYKLAAAEPPTAPANSTCNGSNTTTLPASTCIFNDVTVGNTNIPGETGFTAGTGYDETTGLGSVNVTNLVNQWHTAIINATTTTLTLNPLTITHGAAVQVGIVVSPVAPATGTPTGDVSLVANSTTGQGADFFNLTNGLVDGSVNSTVFLPGGTNYQVHAHYEGDGTFLGSDSLPVTVTVNPEASQTNLGIIVNTPCTTATTVTYGTGGSAYILSVAVADIHSAATPCIPNEFGAIPTGIVNVTDNGSALDVGNFKLNSAGYLEDQTIQLSVGAHNIQATYQGDNSFSKGTPTGITVTVTKASTTATVTSSPASVAANTTFSLTVLVDTQTSSNPPVGSSGVAPTGTITFSATTTGAVFKPARRDWPGPNQFIVGEVCALLACLLTLTFATKRRRGTVLLGIAMVIVIAVGTSCGSSSSTGSTTMTLGTVNVSAATDANKFAAATATLSNAKLATTGTITATYSGDGNYNSSTSPAVTVTVH
jgi:subtilase family serine protease